MVVVVGIVGKEWKGNRTVDREVFFFAFFYTSTRSRRRLPDAAARQARASGADRLIVYNLPNKPT